MAVPAGNWSRIGAALTVGEVSERGVVLMSLSFFVHGVEAPGPTLGTYIYTSGVEAPGPTLGTYIYTILQGPMLAWVPEGPGLCRAAPVLRGEPTSQDQVKQN